MPWQLVVREVNDNVSIESVLNVGEQVDLPGLDWETIVLEATKDSILLRQYPNIGDYISTPTNPKFAVVTDVTNSTFIADANHELAGKTLTYQVEIKNIERPEL